MPYEFPQENPMAQTPSSRKAVDLYDWMEDEVRVAFQNVQRAAYWAARRHIGATGDFYLRYDGGRAVVPTAPASMRVTLKAGVGFLNAVPVPVPADLTSALLVAPVSDPRIDVLAVDAASGAIVIFGGTEAAAPVAPTVTGDRIPVANIYHLVGETTIVANADGSNGYIANLQDGYIILTDGDTTPSVLLTKNVDTPPTVAAPYKITMFDDGYRGQEITITGYNADCVVKKVGNLKLSADWTATPHHTLRLVFGGTNWREISRSANS